MRTAAPRALADMLDQLDPAERVLAERIARDLYPERFISCLDRARVKGTHRAELVELMRAVFIFDWDLAKIRGGLAMANPVVTFKAALAEIGRLHA